MERLKFWMHEVFPPDDAIARWIMNLSMALGDLRIVAKYATRGEQPDYERIYFVRVFASHLREISKLLVDDYKTREDVREFVATLPQAGQDARAEVDRMLHVHPFKLRPDVILWQDLKRVRDDTFHYASNKDKDMSQERLRAAMVAVSTPYEQADGQTRPGMEGVYVLDDEGWLRADYADLVTANRMHPFREDESLLVTGEMHDVIIALNGEVATFIAHAEASYLLERIPAGVVTYEDAVTAQD